MGRRNSFRTSRIRSISRPSWEALIPHHPLGSDADPTRDPRTSTNRRALGACLYLYYSGDLTETLHDRRGEPATIGLTLGRRMVSLLEIGNAVKVLATHRADLYLPLELVYRLGWSREHAAEALNCDPRTLSQRIDEALNLLIEIIWRS